MRQPGWYWVKVDPGATWTPLEFTGSFWWAGGTSGDWAAQDDDFHRIHEQPLEEPIEEE